MFIAMSHHTIQAYEEYFMPQPRATLYRMVTDDHICPFGIKARDLLEREGFELDDNYLETREETDEFKQKHDVETTPQVFIKGERIGGYDALREHLGKEVAKDEDEATYAPITAVFSVTAPGALALSWNVHQELLHLDVVRWFVALSMCVLAIQKLRDLESFTNQFITYDLLGRRVVRYAYVYPFAEAFAGVGMLSGAGTWVFGPVALFIGAIGAVSVIKAVYIDKRDLKCACVGGDSNVPLGAISLSENLGMVAMAIWMMSAAALG